jgi:hypothetical protein
MAELDGVPIDLGLGAPLAGGSSFAADVALPPGASLLSIQARDAAGNIGPPADIAVR